MRVEHCRSCGARIIWAITAATGRSMPVDADPVEHGNVVLESVDGKPLAFVGQAGEPRYVSHFVSCPEANRWRR